MNARGWKWANLSVEKLQLLSETEKMLGAGYLLVYQPRDRAGSVSWPQDLTIASLSDDQIERLRGLETQLGAVVVAYAGAQA
ncbi:MAG: hypothetical protein H3C34_15795 [Caldilineaceae bacterium]|nr:hypothetical protein [Caldilineaceae bacterium]